MDGLVSSVEVGQATAMSAAADTPVHSGESVAVTIYLTGNVDAVVSFLENNGGDPRNVGEDYIEAYVPVTLLGLVSEQPGVIRVREIVPPSPAQSVQTVAGHGPAAHLSTAWNQAGYSGQGIKVGVIDTGFEGFRSLIGTELPTTVQARCYTDLGRFTTNLAGLRERRHPRHNSRRVSYGHRPGSVPLHSPSGISWQTCRNIADWMIEEGVSVINASVGWQFDGPW